MQIEFKSGAYRASLVTDEEAAVLQKHGWTRLGACWRTSHIARVAPFVDVCVGSTQVKVRQFVDKRRQDIAASVAATADLSIPVGDGARERGFDFRGYQKAGVAFMRARQQTLNADVPRLGKTIQSIGVCNTYPVGMIQRVLAITPANAKISWCQEWKRWSTHPLEAAYCEGSENPCTPFLVCNWDILDRHLDYIKQQDWDIVVLDEVHRLQNPKSKRTQMTLGKDLCSGIYARRHRLFLSGTPMSTRPRDIWPICRACDPDGLGINWYQFMMRYCGPKHDGFAMTYDGATNAEELQYRLRAAFMIRREKSDVAEELPPARQTITLPKGKLAGLVRKERNAVQKALGEFENLVAAEQTDAALRLLNDSQVEDPEIVAEEGFSLYSIRRELALAKVPMVVEFVNELLLNERKIVVFAYHRSVVKALEAAFPGCACVIGGMSTTAREAQRLRFQDDENCRVFVGNIVACAENLNLSAADVAVFAELRGVPWQIDQCEERLWLPTKATPITIYRVVVEDSIESIITELLAVRQDNIERCTVAKRLGI